MVETNIYDIKEVKPRENSQDKSFDATGWVVQNK
jgi:hypothetical protein